MKVDGGASVMDLLCQIQADQLGVAVARPTTQETTALGAAYLAGLAEEVWTSLDELRAKWQIDARFEPDDTGREKADLDYASWKRAVSRSLNWQSAPTSSPTSSVAP